MDVLIKLPPFEPGPAIRRDQLSLKANEYNFSLINMRIKEAHAQGLTGAGVKIGIFDTGYTYGHPDLKAPIFDFDYTNDQYANDENGHGTHVAGTIGMARNNSGYIGGAFDADFYIFKVLNGAGSGNINWIIDASKKAIELKLDIVNMSLGSSQGTPELEKAIKAMTRAGIIVVCASGNDSREVCSYPAAYENVISVGSVTRYNELSNFTNICDSLTVLSYGDDIVSTWIDGNYKTLSGTSMATPHISALVALYVEYYKNKGVKLNTKKAIDLLKNGANIEGIPLAIFSEVEPVSDEPTPGPARPPKQNFLKKIIGIVKRLFSTKESLP